jgi:hypothetical protein
MSIPFFNMPLNFANVCRLCMQEKSTLLSLFIDTEVTDQVMPLRCKIMSLAPGVKVYNNYSFLLEYVRCTEGKNAVFIVVA